MKKIVLVVFLLAATTAGAQTQPTSEAPVSPANPEIEYVSIAHLSPEDYINLNLPPLHVLLENARTSPQASYYEINRDIEERELKTVRRSWMRLVKINANYNYGSSDVYNQNFSDNGMTPNWITTTSGQTQNWWNIGASLSIPLEDIFNRRNKIRQQKQRVDKTEYDKERWYDELRMKIIDAYTVAIQSLSLMPTATDNMALAKAQFSIVQADFANGKIDVQTLTRQKGIENSALREYEQIRTTLNRALLQLEVLTGTPIISYRESDKTR